MRATPNQPYDIEAFPRAQQWPENSQRLAARATVSVEIKLANERDLDYANHYKMHGTWRLRPKYTRGV